MWWTSTPYALRASLVMHTRLRNACITRFDSGRVGSVDEITGIGMAETIVSCLICYILNMTCDVYKLLLVKLIHYTRINTFLLIYSLLCFGMLLGIVIGVYGSEW